MAPGHAAQAAEQGFATSYMAPAHAVSHTAVSHMAVGHMGCQVNTAQQASSPWVVDEGGVVRSGPCIMNSPADA